MPSISQIRHRIERRWQPPLMLLAAVGLMAGGYYFIPAIPDSWSPAGRQFFWYALGVTTAVGTVRLLLAFLPERIWNRWSTFGQHRVVIPREGLVYLVIMIVLFVGSLLGHTNMLMLVFAMLAGPFVINGWMAYHMLSSCRVARSVPRRAMCGELFSVEVTLENSRPWLSLWMMNLRDQVTGMRETLTPSQLFTCVPGGARRVGHYPVRLQHRGVYRFGPLQVSSRFPLGLIERRRVFPHFDEIRVYPRIGRLTEQGRQQLFGTAELLSEHRSRPGSYHDEFHHLREFRSGDNPRAIHWRTSARRGTLILRTYQQNREQHLAVVLDLWQPPQGASADDLERQEWALCLVATICLEQRRRARDSRFSLYASGQAETVWEGRTSSLGLESLFDELAVMQAGPARETAALVHQAWQEHTPQTRYLVISTRTADVERWRDDVLQTGTGGARPRMQLVEVDTERMPSWLQFRDA